MVLDSTQPIISVVIPNYNGKSCLPECLDSLLAQSYRNIEIIVADNASSDGSVEIIKAKYQNVGLIPLPANRGFAAAINAGIQASQGEFVVMLNNDTRAEPDFIRELYLALRDEHSASMAAPKMLFAHSTHTINSMGLGYSIRGTNHDIGYGLKDVSKFDARTWIFGPCGGAAMFRRRLLEDVGLFDEDFFMYYEDVDYSFRAQLLGYKCIFVPTARVYHEEGASGGSLPKPRDFYLARNSVAVIVRNYPVRLLLRYSHLIVWELSKRVLSPLLKGDAAALLGLGAAFARMGGALKKRRVTQAHRRVPDSYIESILLKNMSVVNEINLRGRPVEGLP